MATQLHQIIAIERNVRIAAERPLTDAYHKIQKPDLFTGLSRTYEPKEEGGDQLPPESKLLQERVEPDILDAVRAAQTRLFDVVLTKEDADQKANADITVDGSLLVEDVPILYLLFLERQLIHIRTFVTRLPTLDPSKEWVPDSNVRAYATKKPIETVRPRKVPKNHVLAEATKEHPAQVQTFTEDVVVGYWTLREFSGAIPAGRKAQLLGRVDRLIEAVKQARERANTTEVTDRHIGEVVFDYLFAL